MEKQPKEQAATTTGAALYEQLKTKVRLYQVPPSSTNSASRVVVAHYGIEPGGKKKGR